METIICEARSVFTEFVSGYGMVHGDPDSSDGAATNPAIPVSIVQRLTDGRVIKKPKGWVAPEAEAVAEVSEAGPEAEAVAESAPAEQAP